MIIRSSMIGIVALLLAGLGTPCHGQEADILDFMPAVLAANTPDYWVDASAGSDANLGTRTAPFRTITHAVSTAGTGKTIKVMPGTYDTALGETFPIQLLSNQILVGDEANKGSGSTPTRIDGHGSLGIDSFSATLVGAEGAQISGLELGKTTYQFALYALWVDGVTMQIHDNTFITSSYGGIRLINDGTSVIQANIFDTYSYGVYIDSCPGGPVIRNNSFLSIAIPVEVRGSSSYVVIQDNTIAGDGQTGINLSGGTSRIENNTFNNPAGYTYGALRIVNSISTPTIRGNTFLCTTAVSNTTGIPNLGGVSDPGNNDFSTVTGASLTHEGTTTLQALGNTWPNAPPVCGTDIVATGGGSVVFGPGQSCP